MHPSRVLLALVLVAVGILPGAARADAATWYVSATAAPGGDGSLGAPFGTLAAVEQASAPGDTIVVLPAPLDIPPLNGGIALKPGQRLVGEDPPVTDPPTIALPRITNTTASHIDGDAVRLADDTEVTNLVITDPYRGGIYGSDVTGVNVHDNDVSGHNTSCTVGFEVYPLVAPSNAPFVGVPFGFDVPAVGYVYTIYTPNGWAGIMVDATRAVGDVTITDNVVHDATCGDGIDMRLSGTAEIAARIAGNLVTHLAQGEFQGSSLPSITANSLMAIGLQTDDTSRLVVDEVGNTETYIGGPDSDCEGLFFDVSGSSTMTARVDGNTFAHGIGGTSCNGMELITGLDNATADVRVSNSTFDDNPGDMIEAGALGNGSKVRLELDNVTVRNTTIRGGNGGAIPFNIGECLIGGTSGADGVFTLRVRNSEFTGCNNGIMVASNVALGNGVGPARSITVDIADSKIHHNEFYNLWIQNATPLRALSVRVSGTDLSHAKETGFAIDAKPTGVTLDAAVDLGGGALGSPGGNCLFGSGTYDAETTGYHVIARNNWWGLVGGPGPGTTSAGPPLLGSLDVTPVLAAPPVACS